MPVYAFYIQKESDYFGEVAPFGNTYHYLFPSVATEQELRDIARVIVDQEKAVTSSEVSFTGYTIWGPTDGLAIDNVIIDRVELSNEVGAITLQTEQMYREMCALVIWRLPRAPVTNRRRWLRKFLRSAPGDATVAPGSFEGSAQISGPGQQGLEQFATFLTSIQGATEIVNLCTEDGTEASDSGGVRPYFYTRQIGR